MVELKPDRLLAVAPNPSVDRLLEVEELRHGQIHRPVAVTVVPGGKGFNVARSAAALGAPVTALGLLGGHAGRWIQEGLAAEGVTLMAAWRTGETRTCTSILDRSDESMTELYESGDPILRAEWDALITALVDGLSDEDIGLVTVSGSLPPGAPDDGLAQIVQVAKSAGKKVAVDGHGPTLVRALGARPWLVKVNVDEARAALDAFAPATREAAPPRTPLSGEDAVRGLVAAGADVAIVTAGDAGSVASTEDGSLIWVRPPIRGRYPVGSGDALLAGFAVAVLRGDDLRRAVLRGTAAAAASALVPGAGRLDPAAVDRLLVGLIAEPVH